MLKLSFYGQFVTNATPQIRLILAKVFGSYFVMACCHPNWQDQIYKMAVP